MKLGNYYDTKTVKLNDSFVVYMHNLQQRSEYNTRIANFKTEKNAWDPAGNLGDLFNTIQGGTSYDDGRLVEIPSCTEVKLPSYQYNVESHQIGNQTFKMILPKYDAKPTLTLTFAETEDFLIENLLRLIIRRSVKNAGTSEMQYVDNGWLDIIAIDVLSNDLHRPVLRYQFGFCRLVDYSVYDLNYSADDLPTYSMTFSFETYEKVYNPTDINSLVDDTRNRLNSIIDSYNTLANENSSTPLTDSQKQTKLTEKQTVEAEAEKTQPEKRAETTKNLNGFTESQMYTKVNQNRVDIAKLEKENEVLKQRMQSMPIPTGMDAGRSSYMADMSNMQKQIDANVAKIGSLNAENNGYFKKLAK